MIRLEHFLREYRALSKIAPLQERLKAFLEQAGPRLRAEVIAQHEKTAASPEADVENLAHILPELCALLKEARGRGEGLNPWAVAGLRQVEVRNAGVLAAFWDTQLCGDQGIEFLHRFLSRIATKETPLPSKKQLEQGYIVRTEHCPLPGKQSERIDVTVEGQDFIIILEIKINADEGNNQFQRYTNTAESLQKIRGKKVYFILIERFERANFTGFHATWSDISSAARDLISYQRNNSFHGLLLNNFVSHIAKF